MSGHDNALDSLCSSRFPLVWRVSGDEFKLLEHYTCTLSSNLSGRVHIYTTHDQHQWDVGCRIQNW